MPTAGRPANPTGQHVPKATLRSRILRASNLRAGRVLNRTSPTVGAAEARMLGELARRIVRTGKRNHLHLGAFVQMTKEEK